MARSVDAGCCECEGDEAAAARAAEHDVGYGAAARAGQGAPRHLSGVLARSTSANEF